MAESQKIGANYFTRKLDMGSNLDLLLAGRLHPADQFVSGQLAAAAVIWMAMTAPAAGDDTLVSYTVSSDLGGSVELVEDLTSVTAGDALTFLNMNRARPFDPGVPAVSEPTAVDDTGSTVLKDDTLAAAESITRELVLKPGAIYGLKLTNTVLNGIFTVDLTIKKVG